jgi:hypothetical protein
MPVDFHYFTRGHELKVLGNHRKSMIPNKAKNEAHGIHRRFIVTAKSKIEELYLPKPCVNSELGKKTNEKENISLMC